MKNYWIFLLLLSFGLTGCISVQQENPEFTETEFFQTPSRPLSSVTSSMIPVSTVTYPPQTTKTIVSTPSSTGTELSQNECYQLSSIETVPKNMLKGIIPLLDSSHYYDDSFLLNLETDQKQLFPDEQKERLNDGVVSLDGKWFAYISLKNPFIENQHLVITDVDGELIKTIDLETIMHLEFAVHVDGWIDNEHLLLIFPGNIPEYKDTASKGISPDKAITVIINPFTGKWVEYKSDYPEMFTMFPEFTRTWQTNNYSLSVYNKSLDRVLYLSINGLVLWDIENQRQIKIFTGDPRDSKTRPVWSRDDSRFVIDQNTSTGYNLFLISKDGEETQITFFDGYDAGDFGNFSFAPNDKSIAFWVRSEEKDDSAYSTDYQLSVLDLVTLELNDLCISSYMWRLTVPRWYPIWSPDGKYVVVFAQNETDPEKSVSVLVDIENNQVYKLEEDMIPLGWMVSE